MELWFAPYLKKNVLLVSGLFYRTFFQLKLSMKETGEVEDVIHMVQKDDKIYVSEELFTVIRRSFDE